MKSVVDCGTLALPFSPFTSAPSLFSFDTNSGDNDSVACMQIYTRFP